MPPSRSSPVSSALDKRSCWGHAYLRSVTTRRREQREFAGARKIATGYCRVNLTPSVPNGPGAQHRNDGVDHLDRGLGWECAFRRSLVPSSQVSREGDGIQRMCVSS